MAIADRNMRSLSVEKGLRERGFQYIIGSDEAGRGCIAGPVVVASCCLVHDEPSATLIEGVDDSKLLSQDERNRIYEEIVAHPEMYLWNVAEASNQEIEDSNILKATMETFKKSIEALVKSHHLPTNETYSIVDGKKNPKLDISVPCRPWVKGDSNVYTVALASVIAKVTRDRIMTEANQKFPLYKFDENKGYPTRAHIEAVHEHGPSPLHRMSFKPLRGR